MNEITATVFLALFVMLRLAVPLILIVGLGRGLDWLYSHWQLPRVA